MEGGRGTNLEIPKWLSGVNDEEAVELARDLLRAEASLHGFGLGAFTMSARVKAPDGGIDGQSNFPSTDGLLLPSGPQIWQVKSRRTEPSAATEFDPKKRADLIARIKGGDDYVLFWTWDTAGDAKEKKEKEFQDAVEKFRPGAKATVLAANEIEQVLWKHSGVLGRRFNGYLENVFSVEGWGVAQGFDEIDFESDERRDKLVAAIRQHVASTDAQSPVLNVIGDTGVGKSRVVYEALREEGVEQRVLVALSARTLDDRLLADARPLPVRSASLLRRAR